MKRTTAYSELNMSRLIKLALGVCINQRVSVKSFALFGADSLTHKSFTRMMYKQQIHQFGKTPYICINVNLRCEEHKHNA